MPVVLHRNIDTNTQLAIWKMSEPLEKLLQSGVAIPENVKSNNVDNDKVEMVNDNFSKAS